MANKYRIGDTLVVVVSAGKENVGKVGKVTEITDGDYYTLDTLPNYAFKENCLSRARGIDLIRSEPVTGASDLVAVDVRTQELPKVFILREQYDKLDPAVIREKQEEAHCILVPVERDEMDRIRQEAVAYTPMPEIPKLPEIKMLQPTVYDVPHVKGGRYHEPPRDLKKKKKAKRRQQKQARRRNK